MSKTTSGGESIRQVTSGHRSRFILAVVCAASVMCATSAQAQPKVTQSHESEQDFPFGAENKCTTPFSVVSGQGHFSQHTVSHSNGDFTFTIKQNGTGTSNLAEDTAPYQFNSSNTFRIRSSTPNFTFMTDKVRQHMIRKGPLPSPLPSWLPGGQDDFFVYLIVTVSPNSPPSWNKTKEECK